MININNKVKKKNKNSAGIFNRASKHSSLEVKQPPCLSKSVSTFRSVFFCPKHWVLLTIFVLSMFVGLSVGCQSDLTLEETTILSKGETSSGKTQQTTRSSHVDAQTQYPTPSLSPNPSPSFSLESIEATSEFVIPMSPTPVPTDNPTCTPERETEQTKKPPTGTTFSAATPSLSPVLTKKPTNAPTKEPEPTDISEPTGIPPDVQAWIDEVHRLTNCERAARSLDVLQKPSASLQNAAMTRAEESAQLFSHVRPDGTSWSTVLSGIGYQIAGENIWCGTAGAFSPEAVVADWMNSEGHRNNILNPDFTTLAVGFYRCPETNKDYVTQLFIG